MLPQTEIGERTRRAVLKAAGAALGIATVGSAKAHPGHVFGENNKFYGGTDGYLGDNRANSSANMDLVGYHSGGGVGPASLSGRPADAHRGAMSEFRIHDDLGFASIFSARGEHSQRGVAIFDISDFTRAEGPDDLESAELTLVSFVRNDNSQAACMDVKVSDDGEYIFVCKQAVTALFGEGLGTQPNADNHSNSAGAASLVAVDVSDPGNPEVTDEESLSHWSVGPHNGWYHQIGGTEYVFTVHGTTGAASKVNTFRFDRASGQLQQVNAWSWDTNLRAGEYGVDSNQWYHHDVNVLDDPKTGVPLAYLHCWDAGLRVFDLSDPADPTEIGVFEQYGAHHAVPAPALIDGKRVAITGHENPDSQSHPHIEGHETGRYNLVDCDPLDEALDPDSGVERVYLGCASSVRNGGAHEPLARVPYQMYDAPDDPTVRTLRDARELDSWTLIGEGEGWDAAWGFEEEAEQAEDDPAGEDGGPGEYDGFADFRLSAHNLDMDMQGRVYAGHYHAGARVFEVNADGWTLDEVAYFREGQDVPEERAMAFNTPEGAPVSVDGLTASTPFFWNAVGRNGVVFAGGINGGPHALYVDGADTGDTDAHAVGGDVPVDVDVEREQESTFSFDGEAYRITIRADADEDVVVRDAVPAEWNVLEEYSPDVTDVTEIEGYRRIVELDLTDGEATYIVESASATGSYTFGPVEYARANGDGNADVDSDFGGGNSTTNRLWRKDNGAVASVTVLNTQGVF